MPEHQQLRRATLTVSIGAALAVTLAACGSSSSSGASGGPAGGQPSMPGMVSGSSAAAAGPVASGGSGATGGSTVTAVETEFTIALSRMSFTAGRYTFLDKNQGSVTHALVINGPGVAGRSTGDVQPGQTKSLTVTLRNGSYDVYCPVANHKMLGMDLHVTVT